MNPSFNPLTRHIPAPPMLSLPSNRFGKRKLPIGYVPDSTAIICGRGKACTSSPGNKRLKTIVKDHISDYSNARNKAEKTAVVNTIMETIQGENRDKGLFVRENQGVWWEVDDTVAREKVGCMIRDGLHTQYRSSSRAKFLKKRWAQQMSRSEEELARAPTAHDNDVFKPNAVLDGGTSSSTIPTLIPGLFLLEGIPINKAVAQPISFLPQDPHSSDLLSMQTNMFNQDFITQSLAPFPGRIERRWGDDVRKSRPTDEVTNEKVGPDMRKREEVPLYGIQQVSRALRGRGCLDEDSSSPDSSSWGMRCRGRGYLQQARHVIGEDVIDGNLPDDLSGIFDD